jgi:ABC-type lipoprotein release transport system permease subunit
MIRRRDYLRLTVQKLALRKRRAAFAVVSVALGVIVVVSADSLIEGVRDVAVKTIWTEEIDRDQIRVYAGENPYDFVLPNEERQQKTRKRAPYLSESVFEEIRAWPSVEAADRPVTAHPVSLDVFAGRPRPATELQGVPDAVLRRYWTGQPTLSGVTNFIPLVVGERNTRLRFDAKRGQWEADGDQAAWLGRDVTILLGDNYAPVFRFQYDYKKRRYRPLGQEELTQQRDSMERDFRAQYDTAIFNTTLALKARIVGFCPGSKVLAPLETAALCEKWIDQRNRLASRSPPPETDEVVYSERGRRAPKPGEYAEGLVLVKTGADVEAVAKRIEELGFSVATRARTFENQARAFDSGMRTVKRVLFAFGGVIFGLACGLIWSTTSKIVSDSRADIGLFRALGATRRDIHRLFLGEAALQGVLGTIVGIVLGWALALAISHWAIGFARRSTVDPEESLLIPNSIFSADLRFCLLLMAGAAVVSLLAGWFPARRAARTDPVKALKRE